MVLNYSSALVLVDALRALTDDEGFHLPTPEASRALKIASSLLAWLEVPSNRVLGEEFGHELKKSLNECLSLATCGEKLNRQCLWMNYHRVVCSSDMKRLWSEFLRDSIHEHCCALVQQFVLQYTVDKLILTKFPIVPSSSAQVDDLTLIEEKALRFAAGYVIRSTREQVKQHSIQEALLHGLTELTSGDGLSDHDSCAWVSDVDRGGLIHVNHYCYKFFYYLELEIRKYFNQERIIDFNDKLRAQVMDAVCQEVDVVYNWSACPSDLEDSEKDELFAILVDTYIKLRGFSFARSFMEMFKQDQKRGTQKSMGLRKKVAKH